MKNVKNSLKQTSKRSSLEILILLREQSLILGDQYIKIFGEFLGQNYLEIKISRVAFKRDISRSEGMFLQS